MKPITVTAVIEKDKTGKFFGHIEEIRGVVTEADSLEEATETLKEALILMVETKRSLKEQIIDENVYVTKMTA